MQLIRTYNIADLVALPCQQFVYILKQTVIFIYVPAVFAFHPHVLHPLLPYPV
jgi:hypothetical protein